jgi:hypothetical protein
MGLRVDCKLARAEEVAIPIACLFVQYTRYLLLVVCARNALSSREKQAQHREAL